MTAPAPPLAPATITPTTTPYPLAAPAGGPASQPLAELAQLDALIAEGMPYGLKAHVLTTVTAAGRAFPVVAVTLGNPSPTVPGLGVFGGVHGLERIGAAVALAGLRGVVRRLAWDESLHRLLERVRLVFVPVVNPGGLWLGTRANPAGVDLMRNSPVEAPADEPVPSLLGGHRISPGIPWYRGPEGAPIQPEALALEAFVREELLPRPFSLALDCHSGFGIADRLWFPWAHTATPMPHLAEIEALHGLLAASQVDHPYIFEPQSRQYRTHGDLWDWFYKTSLARYPGNVFMPLTLEMGSWLWIRKNPRQALHLPGLFNPTLAHRERRVLRRHVVLMDFLIRASAGWERWKPADDGMREDLHRQAMVRWYDAPAAGPGRR